MPEISPYRIGNEDLHDFERLTAQESHSIEGQIAKMEMIESMIRARDLAQRRAAAVEIRDAQGLTGGELAEAVNQRVQNIRVSRMLLGDGRFNLILEKGDDDRDNDDPSVYRVMIPAHVDTVNSGAPTQILHDPKHPDRVHGLGVYDMGAAVLNNIDLAITTKIPKGMKAYFVFTVDEEKNSVGARELIKQWDVWPLINAVVSSEIGPVPPLEEGDPRVRLITARTGRLKIIGNISIDPRAQGHGSEKDMPNASSALRHLLNSLDKRFYNGYDDPEGGPREPKQQRTHPLLGEEMIEDGDIDASKTREGYFPPDRAQFEFALRMSPPSTQDEYLRNIVRWSRGIAKRGEWSRWGINHSVTRNPGLASYSPYELPPDDPVVRVASSIIQKITGVAPDIVGAPSVSDECDYAEAGKAVITIPPNGDEAHHPDEWVSLSSTLKIRAIVRALLEDPDGFASLRTEAKP